MCYQYNYRGYHLRLSFVANSEEEKEFPLEGSLELNYTDDIYLSRTNHSRIRLSQARDEDSTLIDHRTDLDLFLCACCNLGLRGRFNKILFCIERAPTSWALPREPGDNLSPAFDLEMFLRRCRRPPTLSGIASRMKFNKYCFMHLYVYCRIPKR